MLDEKDLQAIAGLINTSEERLGKKIESRAVQTEKLILNELGRTRSIVESNIATIQKNMDELSKYCRITKLESDNTSLLLQIITRLEKEFDEFKQRTA